MSMLSNNPEYLSIPWSSASQIIGLIRLQDINYKVVSANDISLLKFQVFETTYAPFLMRPWVRAVVVVVFTFWLCASVAMVPHIEIGLEEELSMPEDSYVLKYFEVGADSVIF